MIPDNFRDKLIGQLADNISSVHFEIPALGELPDIWVAKSLLQKAIRRNDVASALRAAQYLTAEDGRSFWRRLPIICWEDIGLVDLNLCATIDLLAGSKRLRAKLGGDWMIAAYLADRMCSAFKDRSADDLLTVLEHDKELEDQNYRLLERSSIPIELNETIIKPAVRLNSHFSKRKLANTEIQKLLGFVPSDQPVNADIFFAGYKRTGSILPLLSAIIWDEWKMRPSSLTVHSDDFGYQYMVGSVPRYAYDGNTRAGRRYLQWLSNIDGDLVSYLGNIRSQNTQQKLIRKLYYRLKSSLVANRADWDAGNQLRRRADQIGFGLAVDQIEEGKTLLAIAMLRYPMSEEHL